MRESFMML